MSRSIYSSGIPMHQLTLYDLPGCQDPESDGWGKKMNTFDGDSPYADWTEETTLCITGPYGLNTTTRGKHFPCAVSAEEFYTKEYGKPVERFTWRGKYGFRFRKPKDTK